MKDRLELILQFYSINSSRLAELLNVQRSGISHILSGRNNPSYDFLVSLLRAFPEINAQWLLTGHGNMTNVIENIDTESINFDNNDESLVVDKESNTIIESRVLEENNLESVNNDYIRKPDDLDGSTVEKVIILYSNGKFRDYRKE